MFTVSCYAFHPFILKFVRIWRYVQVVSEVLTCMMSMLCCQCLDMVPMSTSSSDGSKPSIQVFKNQLPNSSVVNTVQEKSSKVQTRPQHMMIDLTTHHRGGSAQVQTMSRDSWLSVQKDQPYKESRKRLEQDTNVAKKSSGSSSSKTQYSKEKIIPAVHHSSKKINKRDCSMSPSITHNL